VLAFTADLESNLINICNHLQWESYEMGSYHPFYVHEPKLRLVMSLQFPDRIVQWDIYDKLYPFYDKMMIEDSYACRKGKGSHKAANRLQYWLRQVSRKPEKWYYLKLDISKYFYRVDHTILENILSRRIKDERLMNLLHKIINNEDTRFGLPAGNLTSQLFANIYLNELDQYCKHKLHTHYYVRYMDDIIILSNDKRQLKQWKDEIEAFLFDNLHLNLNKKTAIRPISLGIDFVGYKIWATHRKLKQQTARRMIRHVAIMSEMLSNGEMSREAFDRVAASYKGVLEHCNSYGLRQKLNQIYSQKAKGGTADG
jgi:retron-type reverse transcriptase